MPSQNKRRTSWLEKKLLEKLCSTLPATGAVDIPGAMGVGFERAHNDQGSEARPRPVTVLDDSTTLEDVQQELRARMAARSSTK